MLNWKSLLLPQQKWPVVNINTYVYVCIFYNYRSYFPEPTIHSVELNGTSVEFIIMGWPIIITRQLIRYTYMEQGGPESQIKNYSSHLLTYYMQMEKFVNSLNFDSSSKRYKNHGKANYYQRIVLNIKILFIESYLAIIYLQFAFFKIFFL